METIAADLRSLVIGVISGVISGIITVLVFRYWAHRTIKSMKRRLAYAEAHRAQLDELAKSDRSVLLAGLTALFLLLGLFGLAVIVSILVLIKDEGLSPERLLSLAIWILPVLASFGVALLFKQLKEYPETIQKIDKKISEIRRKLTGDRPDGPH
jgi:H+/gluconate symporter-like permease